MKKLLLIVPVALTSAGVAVWADALRGRWTGGFEGISLSVMTCSIGIMWGALYFFSNLEK